MKMHEIVLELVSPAAVLKRNFETDAEPPGHRICSAEIEDIDVGIVLNKRDLDLFIISEIAKGMKVTIGTDRDPLPGVKIRRFLSFSTTTINRAPTGRQGPPRPSPLR